jgi:hypothetical protein
VVMTNTVASKGMNLVGDIFGSLLSTRPPCAKHVPPRAMAIGLVTARAAPPGREAAFGMPDHALRAWRSPNRVGCCAVGMQAFARAGAHVGAGGTRGTPEKRDLTLSLLQACMPQEECALRG